MIINPLHALQALVLVAALVALVILLARWTLELVDELLADEPPPLETLDLPPLTDAQLRRLADQVERAQLEEDL